MKTSVNTDSKNDGGLSISGHTDVTDNESDESENESEESENESDESENEG